MDVLLIKFDIAMCHRINAGTDSHTSHEQARAEKIYFCEAKQNKSMIQVSGRIGKQGEEIRQNE
jgi:hypothetical protein